MNKLKYSYWVVARRSEHTVLRLLKDAIPSDYWTTQSGPYDTLTGAKNFALSEISQIRSGLKYQRDAILDLTPRSFK